MKFKIIAGRALVSVGFLSACFVAGAQSASANANEFRWGEVVGGFQIGTSLDESNGIIHCRIRNATTNELDYPSFDFGYFEVVHLEVREGTNWNKVRVAMFPWPTGASSAFPYFVKSSRPGQVITETNGRDRYRPWPVLTHEDYLKFAHGDTNEALLTEQLNHRLAARESLLAGLCRGDTFDLDLVMDPVPPALADQNSVEARVSQEFRPKREGEMATLYSPSFTLSRSLIQAYIKQSHELNGR